MSLRYRHTLIPVANEFLPTGSQIQTFLLEMIASGVMDGEPKVVLRTPSTRTRKVRNPFTGKMQDYAMKDSKEFHNSKEISAIVGPLQEYDLEVSAMGVPKKPPLPVDFDEPYHVDVTCRMSSELRSTSDLHEEFGGGDPQVPFYGEPWKGIPAIGVYSHPRSGELVEVPGGACARFWIEFGLGNNLVPRLESRHLNVLDPDVVEIAERVFETEFVQGCYWG